MDGNVRWTFGRRWQKYLGVFFTNLQPSLDYRIVDVEAQKICLRDFSSSLHSSMSYSQKAGSRVYYEPKNNQGQHGARTGWHNILPHLHPQPQILTGCKNPSVNAKSYKFSSSFCRKELGIYAAIYATAAVIVHICLFFTHIPLQKKKSYSGIGKSVSAPTLVISIWWGYLILRVTLFINTWWHYHALSANTLFLGTLRPGVIATVIVLWSQWIRETNHRNLKDH